MDQLVDELNLHNRLYHVANAPEIPDWEYDALYRELEALEAADPDAARPDSPTRRVGDGALDALSPFVHPIPMLSLQNGYRREEGPGDPYVDLHDFEARIRRHLAEDAPTEIDYVVEPKLDGLAMELVYEDGVFVAGGTRGDGATGEDVSHNLRVIPTVPLRLASAPAGRLTVRGEVLFDLPGFERMNAAREAAGERRFENPRNSAAGTLRQLDPAMVRGRPLHLVAHSAGELAERVPTHHALLERFAAWGFRVNPLNRVCRGIDAVIEAVAHIESVRSDLEYEIDGAVVKVDSAALRDALGFVTRSPRWALAFKYPPPKVVTRLKSVLFSVGRTGVVTPVAFLLPVEIGGVTVARATLHNREEVGRKDVREGDRVRIQRAGDVIPQVIERIEEPGRERSDPWQMPAACPSCGTPLIERGPFTVCPNSFECPAQLAGRIVHFASRNALDIEGLGDESAKLFVSAGLVRHLPDLFALRREQIAPLEGFAEKSATKLVEALLRARKTELARFLYGLGIPEVGTAVARDLARHFRTFERIRGASAEELQTVPGVGPRMAEQILAFFAEPQNSTVLDALTAVIELAAVTVPAPAAPSPLAGKKFVFTGGLETLSREQAKERIEQLGARAVSSVSKTTAYVVVGSEPGSKADDAARLGVRILDEAGFLALFADLKTEGAAGT